MGLCYLVPAHGVSLCLRVSSCVLGLPACHFGIIFFFFFFFLFSPFCNKLCSVSFMFFYNFISKTMHKLVENICTFVEKSYSPTDCPTFNHYVMFSNDLNESFLPSLSLTSNIYCWRCLWLAGGVAGGWRGLEKYRTLQCASAKEAECGPSSTQP